MIEVDGKAIPLEPGRHYLLVVNPEQVDEERLYDAVDDLFKTRNISVYPIFSLNPEAVRVIQVEQPEKA